MLQACEVNTVDYVQSCTTMTYRLQIIGGLNKEDKHREKHLWIILEHGSYIKVRFCQISLNLRELFCKTPAKEDRTLLKSRSIMTIMQSFSVRLDSTVCLRFTNEQEIPSYFGHFA